MTAPSRLPGDFSRNAAYPLFAFDPVQAQAWVLHFEPGDYQRASFLDRRAMQHREVSGWVLSRAEVDAAVAGRPDGLPLHWLFHIGHCGSSLVSRLLDLIPGVLGLREPLPLLTLAHGRGDPATDSWRVPVVSLLARGFADTAAIVVKPTSVVTTLAPTLLAEGGRACLLWVDLQTWLATMLRDEQLKAGVFDTEPLRLQSLDLASATTDGERLARAWLAEQLRWQRLASDPAIAPRLLDLDFARVIADPAGATARLAAHYGLAVPADWVQRIAGSRLLGRYAKDDAVHFDADARRRELAAAATRHADAIAEGLQWAERAIAQTGTADLLERLRPRG